MTLAISPTLPRRAASIVFWLRAALRPRHNHFYLLCRELRTVQPPQPPADVNLLIISRTSDEQYRKLLEICGEQGLDEQWVAEQLAAGSTGHLALLGDEPAGVGFVTTRPYLVAEIAHVVDPGAGGCYLYGTYVRPKHRGRRIQRLLDAHRMLHARERHASARACAVVESENAASLRGHAAGGFVPTMRIDLVRISSGHALAHVRRLSPSRPAAGLTPSGLHLMPSLRLVRLD